MNAKDMFKELDFDCHDDREQKGLPLSITYIQPNPYELGGHSPYVEFILPDRNWRTNIVDIEKDNKIMQAISQQKKELGWFE